jgi:hypothetical protein|tara:strand:- start:33 stop:479 length:447 start_codon:yes stop_codon:yes gene_type:complete
MSDQKQPDWDKITEGKIRHGIAVEAFGNGMELSEENMRLMEKWVQFIIHGYDGIKDILKQSKESEKKDGEPEGKPLSNGELIDAIVDTFEGKKVEETDEDYVKTTIDKAVKSLGQKDKNKVLYQLKQGNITVDNLQACLDKIATMKHF